MSNTKSIETVGRVIGLWRYPVKSMGAEPLNEVEVSWHGLIGDRRWAFIRPAVEQSGFPWLTIRNRENMSHYRPSFADPSNPDTSRTIVRTPSGLEYEVTDPALSDELYPGGTRVIRQSRGIFDTFPLSLITTQTIFGLGKMVGETLDVQRFRPNFLIEPTSDQPFIEDDWVGCILHIGDLLMRVDKRDGRCSVITIDPETAERNPAVLRSVVEEREGCLGVYGTVVVPGRVAIDDVVQIDPIYQDS